MSAPTTLMAFLKNAPLLMGTAIALSVLVPSAATAENLDHLRQLLRTNECENCDLRGANLSALDLTDAVLTGSDLSDANLNRAILVRANLEGTTLRNTTLNGSDFRGANLRNANLSGAQSSNLCNAGFGAGVLEDCQFFHFLLVLGTDLCLEKYGLADALPEELDVESFCQSSELENFSGFSSAFAFGLLGSSPWFPTPVSLIGADLTGANLSNASLVGTDFRYATLTATNLQDADLTYAFLIDADWNEAENADWSQTYRTNADVTNAVVAIAQEQATKYRRNEGATYIGSINRAQQAHYLEYETFAATIADLYLGITETTENYQLAIARTTDTYAIHTASPLQNDLPSYVGVAYLRELESGEASTQALLCVSTEPMTEMPSLEDWVAQIEAKTSTESVMCPEGFSEYSQ
ncbi:MAG: pentapeptide repeat-containing protein [Leptolyngbyaceae bacterium]|nr:pentapeptide repeat-containing protein [Leptolyngbyaceae bacterium]